MNKRNFICVGLFFIFLLMIGRPASAALPMTGIKDKIKARLSAMHDAETLRARINTEQALLKKRTRLLHTKGEKDGAFEIVETSVTFSADEAGGSIEAGSTVTIRATGDGTATVEFAIEKLDSLTLIDGDGSPVDYEFNDATWVLTAHLNTTLNTNDEETLVFTNSGAPDCSPDDFFGMTFCAVSEEIVFFTSFDWMPTKLAYSYEDLYTSTPLSIDVTTPPDYIAAATADLDSVEDFGDHLVHHFTANFGSTFLGFAYSQYEVFESASSAESGSKPIKAYVHTGTTEFAQIWADTGADIIDFFTALFSPYFYNKHDIIQTINEMGGGVGPQSATFYYADAFTNDPEWFNTESIFSHEIAHQWWGNIIRLGDGYSPWLNEGFAEYSSRLFGFECWPEWYIEYLYQFYFYYFALSTDPADDVPISGSGIVSADAMVYQAITYWKGAHILRMMEWLMGDAFSPALSAYAQEYASDINDELVDVEKFQTAMEESSGRDLTDFFQQWVFSAGYPIYRFAAQFDETDGGYSARVRIEQEQETGVVYNLPLPVEIWVGDETESRQYSVEFDGAVADVILPLDAEPRAIRVDDGFMIWGDKIPALIGDVDGSNDVDGIDLLYVAWAQGGLMNDSDHWNYYTEADFNRDGEVNDTELQQLLEHFGEKGKIDD